MWGDSAETLGAVAHPGGLLVRRAELTVGVVQATSRSTGLELDLLARLPLDRRSAIERQRDIRRAAPVAPRRRLPAFDEGMDLRLGRVDDTGRAHWEHPAFHSSSSGDHFEGRSGPVHDFTYRLPPLFDEVTLVLAWPEIGFPETLVTVALPDRATVDRATRSIWDAPVTAVAPAEDYEHHVTTAHHEVDVESGTSAAPPQVLHRNDHAVVVLTRLTAVDHATLSVGLTSSARGDVADTIGNAMSARLGIPPAEGDRTDLIRSASHVPAIAVVTDGKAFWTPEYRSSFTGGNHGYSGRQDFIVPRPHDDVLDLLVTWPPAGLPEAHARIQLDHP
ncbi:hypothetical protein AB0G02_30855 [Actinosynnema sp. NPDC023658]|uniref:hypothetical protein n=1 Tax=Actinosynnema sp. NPDC023658 TaxID=3155465 RepID=UPI0034019E58